MRGRSLLCAVVLVGSLGAAVRNAGAAATYPQLPPLASIVTGIVGYQLPVVCEPSLAQGAGISPVSLSISYAGQQFTYTPQYGAFPNDEDGVTLFNSIATGAVVSVSYGGQTATLPAVPATTPATSEDGLSAPYVAFPIAVALDLSACNVWAAPRDGLVCGVYCGVSTHGEALLAAVHEAMHVRYAEGNEALTECRALQALPGVISSLFPSLPSPGKEPARPRAGKGKITATYRAALARWKTLDASWRSANAAVTAQQAAEAQLAVDARAADSRLPAQYHGGAC